MFFLNKTELALYKNIHLRTILSDEYQDKYFTIKRLKTLYPEIPEEDILTAITISKTRLKNLRSKRQLVKFLNIELQKTKTKNK